MPEEKPRILKLKKKDRSLLVNHLTEKKQEIVSAISADFSFPEHRFPELMDAWFKSLKLFDEGRDWEPHNAKVLEILGKTGKGEAEVMEDNELFILGQGLDKLKELDEVISTVRKGEINQDRLMNTLREHAFLDKKLQLQWSEKKWDHT